MEVIKKDDFGHTCNYYATADVLAHYYRYLRAACGTTGRLMKARYEVMVLDICGPVGLEYLLYYLYRDTCVALVTPRLHSFYLERPAV
jgi:hypothetical protein